MGSPSKGILQRLRPIFFAGDAWRWIWQILLYIPIVMFGTGLIVGPIVLFMLELGWLPPTRGPVVGWWPTLIVTFLYLVGLAAVVFTTHWAQIWLRRSSLGNLGLNLRAGWLRDLLLGCGLGALLIAISVSLSWLMGWYHPVGFAWQYRPLSELLPALVMSLLPNVQAGLLEEVAYRGYLLQVMLSRWNVPVAVLATSFLFALSHLANPEQDYPTWMVLVSLTVSGLVFAQAYLVRRTLWLPIGLHFAYDWLVSLVGEVGRGPEDAVFLVTQASGPPLLQGPHFAGMGLFDLIGLAVVALILWRLGRRPTGRASS